MNCYVHQNSPAVGLGFACQKAVCRDCVGRDRPEWSADRVSLATACSATSTSPPPPSDPGRWYICLGIDADTMRPRVARGALAIGNVAVGVVAVAESRSGC